MDVAGSSLIPGAVLIAGAWLFSAAWVLWSLVRAAKDRQPEAPPFRVIGPPAKWVDLEPKPPIGQDGGFTITRDWPLVTEWEYKGKPVIFTAFVVDYKQRWAARIDGGPPGVVGIGCTEEQAAQRLIKELTYRKW